MKLQKPTPGLEVCGPEGSPDYWGVISETASVRVRCPTNSPQSSSYAVLARCDGVLQREHRNQNHPLAFVSFFSPHASAWGRSRKRYLLPSIAKPGSYSDGAAVRMLIVRSSRSERSTSNKAKLSKALVHGGFFWAKVRSELSQGRLPSGIVCT